MLRDSVDVLAGGKQVQYEGQKKLNRTKAECYLEITGVDKVGKSEEATRGSGKPDKAQVPNRRSTVQGLHAESVERFVWG